MPLADRLRQAQTDLWAQGRSDEKLYRDLIQLSIDLARDPAEEAVIESKAAKLM